MDTYNRKFHEVSRQVMEILDKLSQKKHKEVTNKTIINQTIKEINKLINLLEDDEAKKMLSSWSKILNNTEKNIALLKKTYTAYKNTYDKKEILNFIYTENGIDGPKLILPHNLRKLAEKNDADYKEIEKVLGQLARTEITGQGKQSKYSSSGHTREILNIFYNIL